MPHTVLRVQRGVYFYFYFSFFSCQFFYLFLPAGAAGGLARAGERARSLGSDARMAALLLIAWKNTRRIR
jgi:hypothetical protein